MHLVIVARRAERLNELAAELYARHHTRCEIITSDLSDPREASALVEQIAQRGVTVELLVNNAGFAVVAEVEKTDVDRVLQMLRLNVMTVTELTYRFLPGMLSRGHGAIINVSSVAGFQPVAYMAAYAASKGFLLQFTEALWAECYDHGVTLTALCPGTTRTELFDVAGVPGWLKKRRLHSPESRPRRAAGPRKTQTVLHSRLEKLFGDHARPHRFAAAGREGIDDEYFRPGHPSTSTPREVVDPPATPTPVNTPL